MATIPEIVANPSELSQSLRDSHGRQIHDLRVSITDRCNYKCVYCRTGQAGAQYAELSTAEYLRLIRSFVSLGIEKVRLTGGEPLLRRDLPEIIREMATWRTPSGSPLDIAVTTNGHLLEDLAKPLKAAGLSRVTVSMDAVDQTIFERITRIPGSYQAVVRGIRAAQQAGFERVKVNCVLLRGFNDNQIEAFAHFARREDVIVRFIEFMPLDADRHWSRELMVPAEEVHRRIHAQWPLVQIPHAKSETARKYKFADGAPGEIGLIAPVTQPFCGHCSRIRLTADGKVRTCLFSKDDHDLRALLRNGASDDDIEERIRAVVDEKEAGHRINEPGFQPPSRTMVFIGG